MEQTFYEKTNDFYECILCDYNTSRKSSFTKHCSTAKHKNASESCNIEQKSCILEQKNQCTKCGKYYQFRNSLWYHKKNCTPKKPLVLDTTKVAEKLQEKLQETPQKYEDLMLNLLTQNIELQKQVIELCKEKTVTVNNNTTNNNNQNFNMNFFLNEQCKGALDIMDFVSSLKVQLSDLENTGNVGYVKGISDIFLRGLKELDVYKRPIHCSDLKREIMYVKDKDVWEKDENKKKVKKVIQSIAQKNLKQIQEWVVENPESKDVQTKKHQQYMHILSKCTGGIDQAEDDVLFNKIITTVAKEVHIEK
jgi:hypothetical protein